MTEKPGRVGTLGTFAGVFTPSILTILGIILFLRLGFVVGNAGLTKTLVIIAIASSISVLTSLSLAAVATNIEVRGGGDYYLISRTLGLEFGGAIGIVLFLAQSVSIAFYAIGFGEAVTALLDIEGELPTQITATIAVGALFVLAWLGADWASRFQYVVMGLLVSALASFYFGAFGSFDADVLSAGWTAPAGVESFWVVFAIFFPAITGFTQGVSMSGDLRDPGRSLPLGTFLAVGLSTVVYLSVAVLFAGTASTETLRDDTGAMRAIASIGWLIDAGVVAATLSSAMASFLGAPRILQSLASDRIFPVLNFFARGSGPTNNPRRGVLLSLANAIATIGLGNLNAIAPLVSMFFLLSYGLLNYATYYEARAASPSFRPRFRFFDKRLSLLGALACLGVIVAINVVAGAAAVLVLGGIYQYLSRRPRPERWVDSSRSHYFQRAKESIAAMAGEVEHDRNWRPQILAFSDSAERRERLLRFANWIEGGSGLIAAVRVLEGEGAVRRRERAEAERDLAAELYGIGVGAHPLVVLTNDIDEAVPVILQSFGVGPLRANTALFNWLERAEGEERYGAVLREALRFGVHVVALSTDEQRWAAMHGLADKKRRIDVWWFDDDTSHLMLLMAHLCTRVPEWGRASIRILNVQTERNGTGDADLEAMLEDVRIRAEPEVVLEAGDDDIVRLSADASLVFVPMRQRDGRMLGPSEGDLSSLLRRLPMAAGVIAAGRLDLDAGPDSGLVSRLSEAESAAEEARARADAVERQAQKAADAVVEAERTLAAAGDEEERAQAEHRLAELRVEAEERHRRALKARAIAEQADWHRHEVEAQLTE